MNEPKEQEEPKQKPNESWERFERAVQAALSVPKEEVVKSMEEEKEERDKQCEGKRERD